MKNLFTLSLLVCLLANVKTSMAQVGVGITTPNASSILDLTSTSKGMLAPRMTEAQKNAIAAPATGLLIYQTDGAAGFWYYTGSIWVPFVSTSTNTSWLTTGNTGTVNGTHFLGTTDNIALSFRTNNQKSGRIDPAGPVFLGYQAGNVNTDINATGIGYQALFSNTTGARNTATGYRALYTNTTGDLNTASGYMALMNNTTGSTNIATGFQALRDNLTGDGNIATGYQALVGNTTGFSNVAYGFSALSGNAGATHNTGIGTEALRVSTGSSNTSIGSQSLKANTTGTRNTALGYQALLANTTGNNNTALGYGANVGSAALTNATAIGYNAIAGASSSLVLGGTGADVVKVGIGITTPTQTLEVSNGNTLISNTNNIAGMLMLMEPSTSGSNYTAFKAPIQAGNVTYTLPGADGAANTYLFTNGSGTLAWGTAPGWTTTGNSATIDGTNFLGTTDNIAFNFKTNNQKSGRIDPAGPVFLGYQAGNVNTAVNVTGVGYQALIANTSGINNTGFGWKALTANITGNANTATGGESLISNTTGNNNSAYGFGALHNNTTGSFNTATGYEALFSNTTTGNNNTASGYQSLYTNATGSNNVASGFKSLYATTGGGNTGYGANSLLTNTTGTNNTALGYGADAGAVGLTNATAIGYNAVVGASNSMALGGTGADVVKVGIGITTPTQTLEVSNGNTLISNTNNTAGMLMFMEPSTSGSNYTAFKAPIQAGNVTYTLPGADGTSGQVLSTNASGILSWATAGAGSAWGLTGNASTVDGTNYLGTSDNIALSFRVNNQKAGRIDPAGPTFLGYRAGNSNTATNVTGFGYRALFSNTSGLNNTAHGYQALYTNTTGGFNTATGMNVLYNNSTGVSNAAHGYQALFSNTTGSFNTANGVHALLTNSTGDNNTATGYFALADNSTGYSNTANGFNALYVNTTAIHNTAVGALSLNATTTGGLNTALGSATLVANTTGTRNTALGYGADVASGALTNATAIGYNAVAGASNTMVLGATGADQIKVGVGTTTPQSYLETAGSFAGAIGIISANTTLDATHYTVIINSGTPVITLPAAGSTNTRRIYNIINRTGSIVTISTYSNYSGTATTIAVNSKITVQSDGTNWYRIN